MACGGKCKDTHKGKAKGCGELHADGWTCTQPKGHKGDHIACNSNNCDLCTWPPVSFVTKSQSPSADAPKFELVLNDEEAKTLMGLLGKVSGDTARGKLMHGIYHALNAAGAKGSDWHTKCAVNTYGHVTIKDG